ncbi:hypothetical protein AM588_10002446 [Phytophthora nicotianae]|uniref:Myb-like domain-containing protein n=1 Tax=Phytophthora nicotianae TaxID=4792 RepID=A0A0W8CRC4_PHYNI|nr:hypothetical protein AM588_10002446 [Phytophthora nicotianae]
MGEELSESSPFRWRALFAAIRQELEADPMDVDCWEAFRELYHLNDASFRRDMTRALRMIESVTLGPTKLELAFPTKAPEGPKIIVPRALLEKRFGGTRREWRDLSQFNSLPGADIGQIANNESQQQQQGHEQTQEQEQEQHIPDPSNSGNDAAAAPPLPSEAQDWVWSTRVPFSLNGESTESVHSDISEEEPEERPASSRPPRTAEVARAARQEGRRAMTREESVAIVNPVPNERQGGRRKRVRWSEEEEAALIMGYRLYESYSNVWVLIKSKFPEVLRHRSNVDLKDKYRNLVRYGKIPQANDTGATDNDATDDNAGPEDHN